MVAYVVLLMVAPARADDSPLAAGLAAYESLDYERAVMLLHAARTSAVSRQDKIAIARTLAFAHVALDQSEAACAEFRTLLDLVPDTNLDSTISPRVKAVFERAKLEWIAAAVGDAQEPTAEPELIAVALTPTRPTAGRPLAVVLSSLHAATAQLLYRTRGKTVYDQLVAAVHDGKVEVALPGLNVQAPGLEYCVTALDEHGTTVGLAGSVEHPLAVDVEVPPRRPIYRRRWFVGTVSGLAAAGVVAAGIALVVRFAAPVHVTVQGP
jgi:hypothetical protein